MWFYHQALPSSREKLDGLELSARGKPQKMDRGLEGGHVDRGSERRHRVWVDDPPSSKTMGGQGCVG